MVASIHLMHHTDCVGKPHTALVSVAFGKPGGLICLNQAILAVTVLQGAHVNLKRTTKSVSVGARGSTESGPEKPSLPGMWSF